MKALLIAEKHSQMEEIRAVYNRHRREVGTSIDFAALHGHVLALKTPRELNKKYEKWNLADYPVTFDYEYSIPKNSAPVVEEVKAGLRGDYDFIIHAGDPDQEGQLLVDELLLFLNNTKPVKRFWTNNMTEAGILDALKNMKPNSEYYGFYLSALTRSHLDFQFGMNLTVAATVKFAPFKTVYKIGRCKAAILSIVTEREKQIREFVPKTTYKKAFRYQGDDFVGKTEYETADFVFPKSATVTDIGFSDKTVKAPKLFKLSSLQSECYRQFGWSGQKTLELLQQLYEARLVSYPRTDCEYLSTDTDLVSVLGRDYPKTDKDYFNDKKIASEGHTAIIPTGERAVLAGDSRKLYDLIDRRFRAVFEPPKQTRTVKVTATADKEDYYWSYTWNLQDGYETVLHPEYQAPAVYNDRYGKGMELRPVEGFAKECTTRPPAKFNVSSLTDFLDFTAEVDGKKISFKIGTPATRASIIEDCIQTGYLECKKGVYSPTDMAFAVMDAVGHLPVFDYRLTAQWEKNFKALQNGGEFIPEEYYLGILHDMVNEIKADPRSRQGAAKRQASPTSLACPKCGQPLVGKTIQTGKHIFTHEAYPNDCAFIFWRDFLGATFTEKEAEKLFRGEPVSKRLVSSKKKPWIQKLTWNENGFHFIK